MSWWYDVPGISDWGKNLMGLFKDRPLEDGNRFFRKPDVVQWWTKCLNMLC